MPYFQSAGRKCANRKTKSSLELLKKSLAMETLAGDFFTHLKCALHKKTQISQNLKFSVKKSWESWGDFLKWWEKVAIFVLLWNKVGHF